jgi:hypothetical protein
VGPQLEVSTPSLGMSPSTLAAMPAAFERGVRVLGQLAAIDETKGSHAPALYKLKKAELAAHAEALVVGTGWLPAPLRVAAESQAPAANELPEAAE